MPSGRSEVVLELPPTGASSLEDELGEFAAAFSENGTLDGPGAFGAAELASAPSVINDGNRDDGTGEDRFGELDAELPPAPLFELPLPAAEQAAGQETFFDTRAQAVASMAAVVPIAERSESRRAASIARLEQFLRKIEYRQKELARASVA